jgi:ribosomal protein S18 acetylase RimI-like enzyme
MIAYNNNEAVGFTSISIASNGISKLHKLYVVNELQGTGLGRLLLNKAIEYAILNKAYCMILNVNRYNKAIGFYTKAGFKIKETVDIDIGNGFFMNDYVMEMRL